MTSHRDTTFTLSMSPLSQYYIKIIEIDNYRDKIQIQTKSQTINNKRIKITVTH